MITRLAAISAIVATSALFFVATVRQAKPQSPSLAAASARRASTAIVRVSPTVSPDIPHWKGFDKETVRTLYWYDPKPGTRGSGFFVQQFCHVGQWGTHVDPPAHFVKGGRTVHKIDPKKMVMPFVVLDVHEKVARDPDYVLSVDDVKTWETRHGPVPQHAFVAMRTDWSKRWSGGTAAIDTKDSYV